MDRWMDGGRDGQMCRKTDRHEDGSTAGFCIDYGIEGWIIFIGWMDG